jgi:hypothetical protein
MKVSHVFVGMAVASIVYALLILILPAMMLNGHGMDVNDSAILMGRFFGSALLGLGLTAWFARNTAPSNARSAIILAFFIADVVGFVVSLMAMIAGQMNALGWLPVVIYLVFSVSLGYFQFVGGEE